MAKPFFTTIRRFGPAQWLVLVALVAAVAFTGYQALRVVRHAVYWEAPRQRPIKPWMSIPQIAGRERIPPRVLFDAAGLPAATGDDHRPLAKVAREQNRSFESLRDDLANAIIEYRAFNHENAEGLP